jgi:hypothetical protein
MNKHFETLAVAVVCTVFVLSLQQSCSKITGDKNTVKNTEVKKIQELKNDTLYNLQLTQKVK